MKRLLIKQKEYIAELERAISNPLELLRAAKYFAGNSISACTVKGCCRERPCNCCKSWQKVWKDIDEYLEDNDA